jgi:hypothetical protein
MWRKGVKTMAKCGDCIHYEKCKPYVDKEESFPEVGGCDAFKKNTAYKIGYYIGFGIGLVKKFIIERREKRNGKNKRA